MIAKDRALAISTILRDHEDSDRLEPDGCFMIMEVRLAAARGWRQREVGGSARLAAVRD
jgi:hypothetical protein